MSEPPRVARASCKVAMLGWLESCRWGCVQDAVGLLGGPVEILCCCLLSQDLVRHCPLPPPPIGEYLKLSAGMVRWEEERGVPSLEQGPLTCQPLHSLAWGHLPRMHLPPPPPHIIFFTSPTTPLILKTAEGCSSPPFLQPRGAKFLEPMFPYQGRSVVLL